MFRLRLTLAALLAAAPAAAQVDAAAQDRVMRFVRDFASLPFEADDRVEIAFVDLNQDGTEEALVVMRGMSWCGTMGCSAWALDLTGPEARSVGDFTAHELAGMPQLTNGWLDLNLNGWRMIFDGSRYQATRTRW